MDQSISKPITVFRIGKPARLSGFCDLWKEAKRRLYQARINHAETGFSDHPKPDIGLQCGLQTRAIHLWGL